MSKLAMHVEHYKRGSVGALDQHNLRTADSHSNEDIDPERSEENIQLLTPDGGSLYAAVKEAADQAKGRVTANSVLVTEWIVYPPENLQNPITADREKLKSWGNDVLAWMKEKNLCPMAATIHLDETTAHMHIDTMPFTQDGRLSRKELYTRSALSQYHTDLATYLAEKGWDIQRGDVRKKGEKGKSKTVREYKAWAEGEKARMEKELSADRAWADSEKALMAKEVSSALVWADAEKARVAQDLSAARANAEAQIAAANEEVKRAEAYVGQLVAHADKQRQAYEENQQILRNLDQDITETEKWLNSNPDFAREVARTAELRRLRLSEKEALEKIKRYEDQLKIQSRLLECLREDLKVRVDDYVALKEKKKEAWASRSEAEKRVAELEELLEDAPLVEGIIVRMLLCGATSEARAAKAKHETLCAAVRAQKHKLQSEQKQLLRQSKELDQLLKDGVDATGRQNQIQKQKNEPQR